MIKKNLKIKKIMIPTIYINTCLIGREQTMHPLTKEYGPIAIVMTAIYMALIIL